MHRLLLKRSPKLDRESLIGYAKELGLDIVKFTQSIDSKKGGKVIERDIKLATDLDLYNTPTFFINGRKVTGNVPYEYLKKVMLEELNK